MAVGFRTHVFIDGLRGTVAGVLGPDFVRELEAAKASAHEWGRRRRANRQLDPDQGSAYFVGDLDAPQALTGWGATYTHAIGSRTFEAKLWKSPREEFIGLALNAGDFRLVVDWSRAELDEQAPQISVTWTASALHRGAHLAVDAFEAWLRPLMKYERAHFKTSRVDLAADLQTDEVGENTLPRRLVVSYARNRKPEKSKRPKKLTGAKAKAAERAREHPDFPRELVATLDPDHPLEADDAGDRYRGRVWTGFNIGTRGALYLRVYNKSQEVRDVPTSIHVADFWRTLYVGEKPLIPGAAAGWYDSEDNPLEPWDGRWGVVVGERTFRRSKLHPEGRTEELIGGAIMRAEFELQGEPLRTMDPSISLVDHLWIPGRIEAVWAYLTHDWCRIVEDDPAYDPCAPPDKQGRPITPGVRPEDRETQRWWRMVQLAGTIQHGEVTRAVRREPLRKASPYGHKAGIGNLTTYAAGNNLDPAGQVELLRWVMANWRTALASKIRHTSEDSPLPVAFDQQTQNRLLAEYFADHDELRRARRADAAFIAAAREETDRLNVFIAGELARQLVAAGITTIQQHGEQQRPPARGPWTPRTEDSG